MAAIAPLLAMFVILFLFSSLRSGVLIERSKQLLVGVGEMPYRRRLRKVYGSWQGASQERVLRWEE